MLSSRLPVLLRPVLRHQQRFSSKVALLVMGRIPRIETITMDNRQLAVTDMLKVNDILAKENKEPISQEFLKFKVIRQLKDGTMLYGGCSDNQVNCHLVNHRDHQDHAYHFLPTQQESSVDITDQIDKQLPGKSAAAGTGQAFFVPVPVPTYRVGAEVIKLREVLRTKAMLKHLQIQLAINPAEREVFPCYKDITISWSGIVGKGGDLLIRTPEKVCAITQENEEHTATITDANDSVVENKVEETVYRHMKQTDADCMVQLAAQLQNQILTASTIDDLPRSLSCYGIGLNISQLVMFIRKCEVDFSAKVSKSHLLYVGATTPQGVDKVIHFALRLPRDS